MRKHINRIQTSALLIGFLFLAACGGGGGGSPIDGTDATDDGTDTATDGGSLSLQLLQDSSDDTSDITSISELNPGVLVVEVTDSNGDAVSGEIVTMSTTIGQLSQPTALTDALGRTEVVLTSGGESAAAGTLTASVDGFTDQESNFQIVNDGTTVATGFSLAAGLYDSDVDIGNLAASEEVSSVSTLSSGFFVVTVSDVVTGTPVEGAIVSVSTTQGDLIPSSGQILTNANGIAAAEISSGTTDPGTAATLTVSLESVEASLNFSFGSVDLQIGRDSNNFADPDAISFVNGEIDVAAVTDLSASGSTVLTVAVVSTGDTAVGFDTPLTINFSSACSQSNLASIDTAVTTVNGIAEATYTANGCEGDDDITATISELSGVSATGQVTIEAATIGSIVFDSATPTEITLLGTGTDTATLTFQVLDSVGDGAGGETVTAELSTTVGGVTIDGDSDGTVTGVSSGDGTVSFSIQAGTVPTSVRVEASIDIGGGIIIGTVSDSLVINTGLPDNDSFSLSASILNLGGFDFDGFTSQLTIRSADAFNNPVPDLTAISFTTEYGSIEGSCTTGDGSCSVIWTSQNQRAPLLSSTGNVLRIIDIACDSDADGTADTDSDGITVPLEKPCPTLLVDPADIDFPGQIYGGRTSILAYGIGEESFVDSNGNGIYDWIDLNNDQIYDVGIEQLEPFVDLAEAFLDHNEDGVFGNTDIQGACTSVGAGTSIVSVIDVNDVNTNADRTETIGEAVLCANWQEGGAEEEFIDFNTNSIYDRGNGIYNGTLCEATVEAAGGCTTTLVSVSESTVLNVGGSTPFIAIYDSTGTQLLSAADQAVNVAGGFSDSRVFRISDQFNGPLPSGTTFTVTSGACQIDSTTTFTTPDDARIGGHQFTVSLSDSDAVNAGESAAVSITVAVPASAGGVTTFPVSFNCTE